MALSDIALASRALIRIGAAPISSFNDSSARAEIAGALYAPVRDALLSSYAWNFATTQTELTVLSSPPLADFSNAFGLPNDFLRALSAGPGPKSRGLVYKIVGQSLHTNAGRVLLKYIFQPAEESFPAYFAQALIARLSAEFTIPITENTSRGQTMFALAEDEFKKARQTDAQQDTPGHIDGFTLIESRF